MEQLKQIIEKLFQELDNSIEKGGHNHKYEDSFNDILDKNQKLSSIYLNAKCTTLLISPVVAENLVYEDKFYTEHVISDEELEKSIKDEGI